MASATWIGRRDGASRTWATAGVLVLLAGPVLAQTADFEPPMPRVATTPLVPVAIRADPDRQRALGGPALDSRRPTRARTDDGRLVDCVEVEASKIVAAGPGLPGPSLRVEVFEAEGDPTPAEVFVLLDNPRTPCAVLEVGDSGVLEVRLLKPRRNQTVEIVAAGHLIHSTRLVGAARSIDGRLLVVQLAALDDADD